MALFRIQIRIPHGNSLPEDTITNTFHVGHNSYSKNDLAPILVPHFETYYETIFTLSGSAANYMNWAAAELWVYDLDEPTPRTPAVAAMTIVPTSPGATVVPTEVSCVISVHSLYDSGVSRASQRNRVFIGGLGNAAFDVSTSTAGPFFDADFMNYCATAAGTLKAALDSPVDDGVWLIYSPKLDGTFPVFQGWIDNSPDTQRRRGVASSIRTLWG